VFWLKHCLSCIPAIAIVAADAPDAAACTQCPQQVALKRAGWQCLFDRLVHYQAMQTDPVLVMVRSDCAAQRKDIERKINSAYFGYDLLAVSGGTVPSQGLDPAKGPPKAIMVWQGVDKKFTDALLDAYKTGKPATAPIEPKAPTILPWSKLEVATQELLLQRLKSDPVPKAAAAKKPEGTNPNLVVVNYDTEAPASLVPVVAVDPVLDPPKKNKPGEKNPGAKAPASPVWNIMWLTKAQLACIANLRSTIEAAAEDPYTLVMSHCK
jgi:hypothetical protein